MKVRMIVGASLVLIVPIAAIAGVKAGVFLLIGGIVGGYCGERYRRETIPSTGVQVHAYDSDFNLVVKKGNSVLLFVESGDRIDLDVMTGTGPGTAGVKSEKLALATARYLACHRGRIVSDDLNFLEPP